MSTQLPACLPYLRLISTNVFYLIRCKYLCCPFRISCVAKYRIRFNYYVGRAKLNWNSASRGSGPLRSGPDDLPMLGNHDFRFVTVMGMEIFGRKRRGVGLAATFSVRRCNLEKYLTHKTFIVDINHDNASCYRQAERLSTSPQASFSSAPVRQQTSARRQVAAKTKNRNLVPQSCTVIFRCSAERL